MYYYERLATLQKICRLFFILSITKEWCGKVSSLIRISLFLRGNNDSWSSNNELPLVLIVRLTLQIQFVWILALQCLNLAIHCGYNCVPSWARCDGVAHCLDGSDERDCSCDECMGQHFNTYMCENSGRCLPRDQVHLNFPWERIRSSSNEFLI